MNPDELSVTENESLEIIGAGDGDGWLLVSIPVQYLSHLYSYSWLILCFKMNS